MDLSWINQYKVVEWIPIEKCKDGYLYHIAARNSTLGIYRDYEIGFEIRRLKFEDIFRFTEYHWDIGILRPNMEMFGTAKPIKEIEQVPEFRNEGSFLDYMEDKFSELSGDAHE